MMCLTGCGNYRTLERAVLAEAGGSEKVLWADCWDQDKALR